MFRENKEIFELKHEIQEAFSVEIKLQKLFHKGQCLNNTDSKGVRCILADYNVCAGDQIYLIKLLCELPSKILKITLDVDWGYPQSQEKWLFGLITWTRHHRDYLDASCFAFEDNSDEYFVVNIQNKEQPGIKHQSEFLDRKRKRGHHKMSVSLQDLKDTVTHLFFTLSARGEGRTVDHYIAPELNIYESDSTNSENLCETSLAGCSDQSVIICSVYRSEDSVWRISDVRKSCKGNINDTSHLVSEMKLLKNKIK
ncbi:uncharacterized protein LOC134283571 [Saccostrea cucullata]|uniref:uncharacterized protein LOC134283571 n=1 Tax=Saccostrea cuccullata TaxID=36930 RepID=UPI002ED269F1